MFYCFSNGVEWERMCDHFQESKDVRYQIYSRESGAVELAMRNRQAEVDVAGLIEADQQRRQLVTEVEELKAERISAPKRLVLY